MMSLTFGLFTQVSGSGPLGPLVPLPKALMFVILLCILFMLVIALSDVGNCPFLYYFIK